MTVDLSCLDVYDLEGSACVSNLCWVCLKCKVSPCFYLETAFYSPLEMPVMYY